MPRGASLPEVGATADDLFARFVAPLVLGGDVAPMAPLGARVARALADGDRALADVDLASRVELARVRVARRLAPVDHVGGMRPVDWALAAALHDLVQSTHPGYDAAFRRKRPARVLDGVEATLAATGGASDVGDALARHALFGRALDLTRHDTTVRWWTGSRAFLGRAPPVRLLAWPEARRVRTERVARRLCDLPLAGASVDGHRFDAALLGWLARTPLTDLATCDRAAPLFRWTAETLGLVAGPAGRALALRALARSPAEAVDAALGRASRALLEASAFGAANLALELLADRALASVDRSSPAARASAGPAPAPNDSGFARSAGAALAHRRLSTGPAGLHPDDRARLLGALEPAARAGADELARWLAR